MFSDHEGRPVKWNRNTSALYNEPICLHLRDFVTLLPKIGSRCATASDRSADKVALLIVYLKAPFPHKSVQNFFAADPQTNVRPPLLARRSQSDHTS